MITNRSFLSLTILSLLTSSVGLASVCQDLHQKVGYSQDYASQICTQNSEKKKIANRKETSDCIQSMQNLVATEGLDKGFATLCFYLSPKDTQRVLQNKECLRKYDSLLARYFLLSEDAAVSMQETREEDSFFKKMIQQCTQSPDVSGSQQLPQVYSRTVFHTVTPFADKSYDLGGLSGLTVGPKGVLYAISDNRTNPNLSTFSLVSKPSSHKKMEVILTGNIELTGTYTDLEDIALDSDGHFIVSSEEIPGRTYKTIKKNAEPTPQAYVFKMDNAGRFLEDIKTPDEFYSRTLELDALCGRKEEPNVISFFKELFTGSKKKKLAQLNQDDRKRCENYNQADGIRYNKGIESLSLDNKKLNLYFIPEQPLMKKNQIEKTVPLVRQNLRTSQNEIYNYPLDLKNENGVVGLLKVNSNSILVLERGYDEKNREADVRLYKTQIPTDANPTLKKELLLNFKELLNKMPLGLQKVDNFEGLTFGPILPNGNRTLIFVSDNNLSLKQKTDFLILEVPQTWFE